MGKLIAIRHGQSTWNAEKRFTGWVDVDLSDKGIQEAEKSGKLLKLLVLKGFHKNKFSFYLFPKLLNTKIYLLF